MRTPFSRRDPALEVPSRYRVHVLADARTDAHGLEYRHGARRVRLDNMNVMQPDDAAGPAATRELQIARIPIPDAPPETRTFVLTRFPRAELLPQAALLHEAAGELR